MCNLDCIHPVSDVCRKSRLCYSQESVMSVIVSTPPWGYKIFLFYFDSELTAVNCIK